MLRPASAGTLQQPSGPQVSNGSVLMDNQSRQRAVVAISVLIVSFVVVAAFLAGLTVADMVLP